jgi:hypothetical protein
MNQEEKLERKLSQLKEKRVKLKDVLESQQTQLKKVDDEISVLEKKKNEQLLKSFQSNLQKEGLDFDQSVLDEVIGLLRSKKTDDSPIENETPSEKVQDHLSNEEAQPISIPVVPDAFR